MAPISSVLLSSWKSRRSSVAVPGVTGLSEDLAGGGPASAVVPPSGVLVALRAAVVAVQAVDPGLLDGGQALADARQVLASLSALHAEALRRVADVQDRALYRAEGYAAIPSYGYYRSAPKSRSFAKDLAPPAG